MKILHLGWSQKLVDAVADQLLAEGRVWDDTLVIVPTMESSLSLLRVLAHKAGAVLPPLIRTTESLLHDLHDDPAFAELAVRTAWAMVLCDDEGKDLEALIKIIPEERTLAWAYPMADICLQARRSLAECLKRFGDVANAPSLPCHEKNRWQTLERLEKRAAALLGRWGLRDPSATELAWACQPVLPDDVNRVIIACVPDPIPLVMHALSRLEEIGLINCECWVHAPDTIHTDAWGRPLPSQWSGDSPARPVIAINEPGETLVTASDPDQLARTVIHFFGRTGATADQCTLGLADDDCAPPVQSQLEDAGWPVYLTMGVGAKRTGVVKLLDSIRDFINRSNTWPALEPICRSVITARLLALEDHPGFCRTLDLLMQEHLPDTVSFVRELLARPRGRLADRNLRTHARNLEAILSWLAGWERGCPGPLVQQTAQALSASGWAGPLQEPLLEELDRIGARITRLGQVARALTPTELMELVCCQASSIKMHTNRNDSVIKMQHWLDLSYDPADYIALAGLHEGAVPDTRFEDPLLPESLRLSLGLRTRADRFARDAFLLAGMVESRKSSGRTGIFVSRKDSAGNPCTPSSLLLMCEDEELPRRVQTLFRESDEARVAPGRDNTGWEWNINSESDARTWDVLTPSDLKNFLSCPLRFWLQKEAGFRRLEFTASPAMAGNAVHSCAEHLGPGKSLGDVSGEAELVKGLHARLQHYYESVFGKDMTLPVLVQLDYARDRLERLARVHLDARDEGWEVVAVEEKVEWRPCPDSPLILNMRIDRLERHHGSGILRVVDFKTRKKAQSPAEAHWEKLGPQALESMRRLLPELTPLMTTKGKKLIPCRWKDLQLPVYQLAASQQLLSKYNATSCCTAYFNLPLVHDGTGYEDWAELDEPMRQSALDWILAIADILSNREGASLPSAEILGWKTLYRNDPFSEISPNGITELLSANREVPHD